MELLRIISIFMIVLYHCAFHSQFQFEADLTETKMTVTSLYLLGQLGVNLFMLISGYFMIKTEFKWKKVITLIVEVQFYWWITLFLADLMGVAPFPTGKELFLSFFPIITNRWWFITAYLVIYVLSPFLNLTVRAMDNQTYRKLLTILLTLYCVIPTFFGFFYNSTETLLYYNRLIWLGILYLLGGYLSRVKTPEIKSAIWMVVGSVLIMVGTIPIINSNSEFFNMLGTQQIAYFMTPNNIPMIILSVAVFTIFAHIKMANSPIINTVASTTLGIYLFSDSFLNGWLWRDVFRCAEYPNFPEVILRILGATTIVFLSCVGVDLLRQFLFRGIAKAWKHFR